MSENSGIVIACHKDGKFEIYSFAGYLNRYKPTNKELRGVTYKKKEAAQIAKKQLEELKVWRRGDKKEWKNIKDWENYDPEIEYGIIILDECLSPGNFKEFFEYGYPG